MNQYQMLKDIYEAVNRLEGKFNERIDNVDSRINQMSIEKASAHRELYKEIGAVDARVSTVEKNLDVYKGKASMIHVIVSGMISIGAFIISLFTFYKNY